MQILPLLIFAIIINNVTSQKSKSWCSSSSDDSLCKLFSYETDHSAQINASIQFVQQALVQMNNSACVLNVVFVDSIKMPFYRTKHSSQIYRSISNGVLQAYSTQYISTITVTRVAQWNAGKLKFH